MIIYFYCKIPFYKMRETSKSDLSIRCDAQLAYEATSKIVEWKIAFVLRLGRLTVIQMPQNDAVGV